MRLLVLCVLLGVTGCGWQPDFALCSTQKPCQTVLRLESGRKQTIVCYGTSLTAGGAWVSDLQDVLNEQFPNLATVVNSGEGAMNSAWGVEHVQERVIELNPDLVLMEFSINDAFLPYQLSTADARKNTEAIIDSIREHNKETEIILLLMNPPFGSHSADRPHLAEYESLYRDVAKARGLRIIDCSQVWKQLADDNPEALNELMPDLIHPNEKGCSLITTACILRGLGLNM